MSVSWTARKNGAFFNIASFYVTTGSLASAQSRLVRTVVSQCGFGSFCILICHRHGKLLCLWRLQKLWPVRTSSQHVSITRKRTVSFVPGAVCAGEETGFLFRIGFEKRGRV